MQANITLGPAMHAWATQHNEPNAAPGARFVSVQILDGTDGMVSLYVDPPNVGKFMDMLQGVMDQLDAMPAFDRPVVSANSTLDSGAGNGEPAVAAAVTEPLNTKYCKLKHNHNGEHEFAEYEEIKQSPDWARILLCFEKPGFVPQPITDDEVPF